MAPSRRGDLTSIGSELIGAALDVIGAEGGGRVDWWVLRSRRRNTMRSPQWSDCSRTAG